MFQFVRDKPFKSAHSHVSFLYPPRRRFQLLLSIFPLVLFDFIFAFSSVTLNERDSMKVNLLIQCMTQETVANKSNK